MANGGDIIIKGGSVDITFDDLVYPSGGNGSHRGQRKLQRIVVTDGGEAVQYDSQAADVKKWTVTVLTGQAADEAA
jgi:hypothetical protein